MKLPVLIAVLPAILASHAAFAADQACFYQDIHFQGPGFCAPVGQEAVDLSTSGWNKRISSITIEGSAVVTLWSAPNFSGQSLKINVGRSDLRVLKWNDVPSSLKIEATAGRVCFFEHVNWEGFAFCMTPGQVKNDLRSMGWNDTISSVRIEGNASVTVWEDIEFGGRVLTLKNSIPAISGWNDRVSSIKTGTQ